MAKKKASTSTSRKKSGNKKSNTAGKRSSANKKKTTGRAKNSKVKGSTSRRSNSKRAVEEEVKIDMGIEVPMVVSFCLMILMFLSNFGLCGTAGNNLSGLFFGLFGCVQYVMPITLFVSLCVLMVNEWSSLAVKKCFAGFMTLMMISGYVQIFLQGAEGNVYDIFRTALEDRMTGGVIGGGIACFLSKWFSVPGACIIMFGILVISIIMLTQRSVVDFSMECLDSFRDYITEKKASRPPREVKRRRTLQERERDKQCEEIVKELEEQKEAVQEKVRKKKQAVQENKEEEKEFRVPIFKSSDDVKRKDAVQELHPEIYPFTQEDGKTNPFEEELDFAAFSFNSGKSPEEFAEDLQRRSNQMDPLKRKVKEAIDAMSGKGVKEIENSFEKEKFEESYLTEETIPVAEAFEDDFEDDLTDIFDIEDEVIEQDIVEEKVQESPVKSEKDSISDSDIAIHKEEKEEIHAKESGNEPGEAFTIKKAVEKEYIFPPLNLLLKSEKKDMGNLDQMLRSTAGKLQETLHSFGVNVKITDISFGPSVTRYEMVPEQGTKVSKIVSLTDDIKLNLAAEDIRIEAPIPGKSAIGIEVPNKETLTVHFRELIESRPFTNAKSKLTFAVGKDIGGQTVIADIAKMPHLLIAGATGSGKSVCINTLIMSIIYKARPDEVKLIMIDPKMVELNIYNGIPHLLIPVVTDPKKASGALQWAVAEMTERYNKFATYGVRNLAGYNAKVKSLIDSGEIEGNKVKPMPQIVVIIDELADLMMVAPGEVEDSIVRLSQLARAAGIHLVIATQRPSVNVITGLIKANVPSRIAFAVSSGVDSRTIIDMNGAEKLLGKGDMLFCPYGSSKPSRVQGAFISDEEIGAVVDFIKENGDMKEVYDESITQTIEKARTSRGASQDRDEYFEDAARFLLEKDKASIGMLQRMFKVGFNRASRIMEQLSDAGIVGPEEGTKPRKILMSPEQLEAYFEEYL